MENSKNKNFLPKGTILSNSVLYVSWRLRYNNFWKSRVISWPQSQKDTVLPSVALQVLGKTRYNNFYMSRHVTWPEGQNVTGLSKWKLLVIKHHSAKFGVYSTRGSQDIIILKCYVIPRDHRIKKSLDLANESNLL